MLRRPHTLALSSEDAALVFCAQVYPAVDSKTDCQVRQRLHSRGYCCCCHASFIQVAEADRGDAALRCCSQVALKIAKDHTSSALNNELKAR
jgi:hypothetical protein